MKITDPGIIKSGERELFDGIIADLDWKAVDEIFRTNHDLEIPEDVEFSQGDIVVHGEEIAYELDFEVKVTLSILMNRNGDFISVKGRRSGKPKDEEAAQELEEVSK